MSGIMVSRLSRSCHLSNTLVLLCLLGGSFSTCIQDLTSRARKALFALKVQFHKNPEITPSIQLKLFNSLVSPILTYSSGSC